ncbi:MAG TPA: penicillin acylase family protein [Steroidobacteraceae bacterium]|nr:penicillin acylase family protein [Steroidobacteraceae bacterium]
MRRLRRLLLAVAVIIVALLLGAYLLLRSSLPPLDGERAGDVQAAVSIERDSLGVPLLRGQNRRDIAWATGFVHAQDRYFQMDLSRRFAAGELAELFGSLALDNDKRMRIHRFRHVAQDVLARTSAPERELLDAYVSGVNAGLESLASRPFEYWLVRAKPRAWRAEDSVLVVLSMYEQLTYSSFASEASRGIVHDNVPAALYRFLYQRGTEWDAPLTGAAFPSEPIPSASEVNLRGAALAHASAAFRPVDEELQVGSNNWAVAGALTATGHALLANDMHLGLSVPNTWYRARWQVLGDAGEQPKIDMSGVTLPGVPAMVAGSNGHVAWGFTNSYGDWTELIVLHEDATHPGEYLTAAGFRPFERVTETIKVRGQADQALEVLGTIWGPVFDRDRAGRRRAAAWIAQMPEATNLALLRLESARDVASALEIANRVGAPPQNFVAADEHGNIGWTIMGLIPVRGAEDSTLPSDWSQPGNGWSGWLAPEHYPRILNPEGGRIWTANARVVDGEASRLIGEGDFEIGARSGQIRDDLRALDKATESDMLAIQLDDRARFLKRWKNKLLELLDQRAVAEHPVRAEFRSLIDKSSERADVDAVGYRLLREWRADMRDRVFAMLTARARRPDADPEEVQVASQFEGPLWQLLSAEPAHLLSAEYQSWRDLELRSVDATIERLLKDCRQLARCTWGDRNRVIVGHPLGRIPMLGGLLNMPVHELRGDMDMPRVQGRTFGASERFAVSPGSEAQAYFHMPGGQSGHPLSPYYRAGFEAWAQGRPQPFLPGKAEHQLQIRPGVTPRTSAAPAGP